MSPGANLGFSKLEAKRKDKQADRQTER